MNDNAENKPNIDIKIDILNSRLTRVSSTKDASSFYNNERCPF